MKEKMYKVMSLTGSSNIVLGIVVATVGLATGVMMIITGANLLKKKGKIIF